MAAHLTLVSDNSPEGRASQEPMRQTAQSDDEHDSDDRSPEHQAVTRSANPSPSPGLDSGLAALSVIRRAASRSWVHAAWVPSAALSRARARVRRRIRRATYRAVLARESDRGAVTAEYALVIMAAVAFAGLLVAIMRSNEVRQMLVDLVQNALGSAG